MSHEELNAYVVIVLHPYYSSSHVHITAANSLALATEVRLSATIYDRYRYHMAGEEFAHMVLYGRDGGHILSNCIDVALAFAVMGHIAYSVEIINLAAQLDFPNSRHWKFKFDGLYFAWDSLDLWPDFVPAEHKTTEYLTAADDQDILYKWAIHEHGSREPHSKRHERFEVSEASLHELLHFIRHNESDQLFLYSDDHSSCLTPKMAVLRALDCALRLGGHEDDVNYLLTKIYQSDEITNGISFFSHPSYHNYVHKIGQSRRVWSLLKDGRLGKRLNDDQDMDADFEKVKDVLTARVENGMPGLSHLSMGELLEKLNANTIKHDHDDEVDFHEQRELQTKIFMGNRSIFHQPATSGEIQYLERKLGTGLPQDYIDLFRHSNGLERIWNGVYHEYYLAPSHRVEWSERLWDTQVPLQLVDPGSLPFTIQYPPLDLAQTINISDIPNSETWIVLVRPELTKKVVEAVFEALETVNEDEREIAKKVFATSFGSLEALKEMEWCVVHITEGDLYVFKSVRDFVEGLLRDSEM